MLVGWQGNVRAEIEMAEPAIQQGSEVIANLPLLSRVTGTGLLLCSGPIGQEVLDCKAGSPLSATYKSDIFTLAAAGWRLVQAIPDRREQNWFLFFQR